MGPAEILTVYFASALSALLLGWIEKFTKRYGLVRIVGVAGTAFSLALAPLLDEGTYRPLDATLLPPSEFKVDGLTRVIYFLLSGLGFASAVYSFAYAKKEESTAYYTLFLLLLGGLSGALLSNDLFTFYCFWELAAVSAYSLVALRWRYWEPIEASFKYLVACTLGALTTLYATTWVYGLYGTTNLDELRGMAAASQARLVLTAVSMLYVVGLGTTAAVAPLHMWLPDAHSAAPSPVSAMLSGMVVKIPLLMLVKLLIGVFPPLPELQYVLLALGALSMTLGNAAALIQVDVKRLLAYSTVANIGYVLLGLGAWYRARLLGAEEIAATAATGAVVQLIVHALSKSLLFLSFGSAIEAAESRNVTSIEGFGFHMPATGAATLIALVNLIGIPPMLGYYGKALITAGLAYKLTDLAALLALAALEANYAFAAGIYAYLALRVFRKRKRAFSEAPRAMVASELLLAALIVALSVYPGVLVDRVRVCVVKFPG